MSPDQQFSFSIPPAPEKGSIPVTQEEAEQLLLGMLNAEKENPRKALWNLAVFYNQTNQPDKAHARLVEIIEKVTDAEERASVCLAFGQTAEQRGDYHAAIRSYKEALALEPTNSDTWFFILNNLGFSLNTLGDFESGEKYCRQALTVNSQRPNAYKNIGLALQGQGKFYEAAEFFVKATKADARDSRSLALLTKLVKEQPQLEYDFAPQIIACQEAVAFVQTQLAEMQPAALTGWRRKLLLLRFKANTRWKRFLKQFG